MGVQGLWQLLHPAGKPVSPASLEGKVLAVDVSIWLHQTMKGMRDKDGNPLPNAHLQGLFSRVCKLLFYRIRPVFVFDGGVPALKRQTLAARRERKENIDKEKGKTTQKILQNLMHSHAIKGVTGDRTAFIDVPNRPGAEPDMFQLPPLPEVDKGSKDPMDNADIWEAEADMDLAQTYRDDMQNLDDVDFESEEFQSLPPEIRHEILSEMKQQRREHMLARIAVMPEESEDFSDFQLKKLIKQSRLSGKIDSVRKEMNTRVSRDITYALGDDYYGEVVEAQRVVSEDAAHYILIKGLTRKQQEAHAQRYQENRLLKEKRESERNPDSKMTSFGNSSVAAEFENFEEKEESEGNPGGKMVSFGSSSMAGFEKEKGEEFERNSNRKTVSFGSSGSAGSEKFNDNGNVRSKTDDKNVESDKRVNSDMDDEDEGNFDRKRRRLSDEVGMSDEVKRGTHVRRKGRIISDDDMSDEDVNKSRRERRGKALVTRSGLRNVAKKGKGRRLVAPKRVAISEDEDESTIVTSETETSHLMKDIKSEPQVEEEGGLRLAADEISYNKPLGNASEMTKNETGSKTNSFKREEGTDTLSLSAAHNQTQESEFIETRNRLLTEEEDLMKAKEAKMAALMKSLEKRTQIIREPEAEPRRPSTEEAAYSQDTIQLLIQQEEELHKEKENKMAELLKSVEKRSQLNKSKFDGSRSFATAPDTVSQQDEAAKKGKPKSNCIKSDSLRTRASPGTVPHNESAKKANSQGSIAENNEKQRKSTQDSSSGFLEDVVELESRGVSRKLRGRRPVNASVASESKPSSELQSEPSSATASASSAFPSLTANYLEDVESMMETSNDRGDVSQIKKESKPTAAGGKPMQNNALTPPHSENIVNQLKSTLGSVKQTQISSNDEGNMNAALSTTNVDDNQDGDDSCKNRAVKLRSVKQTQIANEEGNMNATLSTTNVDDNQDVDDLCKNRAAKRTQNADSGEILNGSERKEPLGQPSRKSRRVAAAAGRPQGGVASGEDAVPENLPPVARARIQQDQDEESEDEGFIEITIDPSKPSEDDLFPASLFATGPGVTMETSHGNGSILQEAPQSSHSDEEEEDGEDANEDDNDDAAEPYTVESSDGEEEDQHRSKRDQNKNEEDYATTTVYDSNTPEENNTGNKFEENNTRNRVEENKTGNTFGERDRKQHTEKSEGKDSGVKLKSSVRLRTTRLSLESMAGSVASVTSVASTEGVSSLASRSEAEEDVEEHSQQATQSLAGDKETTNFSKGVNYLGDLYSQQRGLATERHTLAAERGRQARLGKSITEQVNLEAQELLQLFGVPFVVSPQEAESQCAHLELVGLSQGTITDDSDSWLFGASSVYKNFFNQSKYVEFYSANNIYQRFCLDRKKMINVALLCGSDYTPGIPGVGPVRAMEVLAEFPGEGLEGLEAFRDWWEDARDGILPYGQGKVKNKLKSLQLHEGFPSRQVLDAYLHPAVDESEERFTWGLPDLELLRQYAKKKFGWGRQKSDEVLEPMMKQLMAKMTQNRIHSYFQPENFLPTKQVQSKRLQAALEKFQAGDEDEEDSASDSEESTSQSEHTSDSEEDSGDSESSGSASHRGGGGGRGKRKVSTLTSSARGRGRGSRGRGGVGKSAVGQAADVQDNIGRGGRGGGGRGGRGGRSGEHKTEAQRGRGKGRRQEEGAKIGKGQGQEAKVKAGRGQGQTAKVKTGRGQGQEEKINRGRGQGGATVKAGRGRGKKAEVVSVGIGQILEAEMELERGLYSGEQSTVRASRGRGGRGRGGRGGAAQTKPQQQQQKKRVVLRDEVSLSESSSDDSDHNSRGKPTAKRQNIEQPLAEKEEEVPSQPDLTVAVGWNQTKSKPQGPNVKKLVPTSSRPAPPAKKRRAIKEAGDGPIAKKTAPVEDVTAFKVALGGDLDPTTMTLDDLGSDFSDG